MQSDARSIGEAVSKTSKATGLHGEIRLNRFFSTADTVMLQPGSEELKRDEINIPPPEQSCNALHGSGFSAARLYTPAHKDAFKYKWMHSCVRATATRRDNDEIPRLIERSPVNRVSTHVGDG